MLQVPVKTVERRITTLVPVYLNGDSTSLRALFECDSLNNVLLKGFEENKSGNMESGIHFKDGVLDYKAKTNPDTVYLPSDTVYTEKEVPVVVEVLKEVNILTKWQQFRMRLGETLLVLLAGFVVWKLAQWKLKLKK